MRLLVDTVSQTNSLGFVSNDGSVINQSFDRRTESRFILEVISQVLEKRRVETSEIQKLMVNVGPGSFTGIKVGLSIIQTFALVHGTECQAFTSFDIVSHLAKASSLPDDKILIYAYQGEYFCAQRVDDSWDFSVRGKTELSSQNWVFQGPERFADEKWHRVPSDCRINWTKFLTECQFQAKISPFYGKQSTAEMNLK